MSSGHLLVIDDDSDIGEFIKAAAEQLGLRCTTVTSAKTISQEFSPEITLILLDLMMPEMDGIEALRLLSQLGCKAPIVLMSGISKRVLETAVKLARALGLEIAGQLQKPFRLVELEGLLHGRFPKAASASPPAETRINLPDIELLRGIKEREFVLHYQPQIDIASGGVSGVEALARWQHPERGLLMPDSFIPRLEAMGAIDDFSWFVVDRGLEDLRGFEQEGIILQKMAVNIAMQSLRNLQFPDQLVAIARRHEIAPERIVLEITESGLMEEATSALDVMARLRMNNVQISIDDFGTGYAMMQQLANVPATQLKIDRAFVQNMQINDSDRVMVEKTIEIGHDLGMSVVAEGVETKKQLEFLHLKGCDAAQGFLFSRALPREEMVRWIRERGA